MDPFIEKYGPWAVITGATSGTGYQFAYQLAKKGINLVLVAFWGIYIARVKKV